MKSALWQTGMIGRNGSGRVREVIDYWRRGVEDRDSLAQMTYVDARLSLSDDLLTYGDKMSMAASIEARVPFLDVDYMRVTESLPPSLRIRGTTQKYIHKKAVAKWLPPDIIGRRKLGFDTPIYRWFRSELSGYVRTMLLSEDAACPNYFRRDAIEALLKENLSGQEVHWRQLFVLLVFELWHRQFIGHHAVPSL
jgi:asparagine synthase (glutamine-hydrolysing)